MLTDDYETIKISDFGISIKADLKENSNKSIRPMNSVVGTVLYMAPEVAMGEEYSEKCDIFSLGVIIYQLIYN